MSIIELKNIKKDYGNHIGVFNINLNIQEGEVYGFIGPNGAGKSTVIRQMVGFIQPTDGTGTILGHDIWKESYKIMENLGYLAGEVAIPEYMTGIKYLKLMASLRSGVDWKYVEKLIEYFDFDPKRKIKKMSKGMKQKVAIIAAFMHKPKILILDEPTSGLDPLMQEKFNQLVANTKKEGGSIFISSHIFGEIENTCDRVAFIKKGKIVSEVSISDLRMNADKTYELVFNTLEDYEKVIKDKEWKIMEQNPALKKIVLNVPKDSSQKFLKELSSYNLMQFREVPFNLESHFIALYGDEVKFDA